MAQSALKAGAYGPGREPHPALSLETRRHLGTTLRAIYEGTLDTQPITDEQVDLLLRLRHKERDLRRG